MKVNFLLVVSMVMMLSFGTSCRSGKNSADTGINPYGRAVVQTECEKLREQKPETRAVGNAQHFRESTAINQAELQARASFARMIETSIDAATKFNANDMTQYAGDDTEGRSVSDQATRGNDLAKGLSSQIIRNLVNIKTEKYMLPNNQYNVFVCLEYRGSVADMAREIAQKMNQMIPDDQKLKLNFEFDKYEKEVEKELKAYKAR